MTLTTVNKRRRSQGTRKGDKTKISFTEGDEDVELEVTAAQEQEFPGPGLGCESSNAGSESIQNEVNETVETEPNRSEAGSEDPEVSFSNNNSIRRNQEKSRNTLDSDEEDEETTRSMMKFARFLEKRGYIRQLSPPPPREMIHRKKNRRKDIVHQNKVGKSFPFGQLSQDLKLLFIDQHYQLKIKGVALPQKRIMEKG